MDNYKYLFNKIFHSKITNPCGKFQFILSLFIGFLFLGSSFNNIYNNGFTDAPFSSSFSIFIGILGFLNAFYILKTNKFKFKNLL